VLERGTAIVGNQIVVGDQVALVGVVPEPADIGNQLAGVLDQRVVDRDDAVFGVAGAGICCGLSSRRLFLLSPLLCRNLCYTMARLA
jgi:hypothetical protein